MPLFPEFTGWRSQVVETTTVRPFSFVQCTFQPTVRQETRRECSFFRRTVFTERADYSLGFLGEV